MVRSIEDFYELEMCLKMYYWGASPPDPPESMPLCMYAFNNASGNVFKTLKKRISSRYYNVTLQAVIKTFVKIRNYHINRKTLFMILHLLTLY